jgi:hypothetical protein
VAAASVVVTLSERRVLESSRVFRSHDAAPCSSMRAEWKPWEVPEGHTVPFVEELESVVPPEARRLLRGSSKHCSSGLPAQVKY